MIALAATLLIAAIGLFNGEVGIPNSDDVLRMVTVRDLLGGQTLV